MPRAPRSSEKFVAAYPSSPRCTQALSDLGLAYLNLGDKQKSLKYYDRGGRGRRPTPRKPGARCSRSARSTFRRATPRRLFRLRRQGWTGERPDGPFARLAVVRRGTETLPRRTAGGCREVAAQLCAELSEGVLPDRRALLFERLLPPLGRAREAIETLTALADRGTTQYTVAVLEKLSEMTYADERWDEAASAYRRLYDAAPTKTGREEAMKGYVRATVAGGDGAKIAAMAADVCGHDDAGAAALREAKYAWAGQLRAEGRRDEAVKLYRELAKDVRTKEGSEAPIT